MEKYKECLIENERHKHTIDMTKSTIQDICNYLNNFDAKENESYEIQVEAYKALVEVLKITVSAYNDKYALTYDNKNIPEEYVEEWRLPENPKDKVEYLSKNLSIYLAKYKLCKEANKDRKENQPYKCVGFLPDELVRFIEDYKFLKTIMETQLREYQDAYKSLYLANMSLKKYGEQCLGKTKSAAQKVESKMREALIEVFQNMKDKELQALSKEKSRERGKYLTKLYSDAEDRAIQRSMQEGGYPDSYYDYYKEEMKKIDDLLQEEEEATTYYQQKHIAKLNKTFGKKNWKRIEEDGTVIYLTTEIPDVIGDEEFIDLPIFKKK